MASSTLLALLALAGAVAAQSASAPTGLLADLKKSPVRLSRPFVLFVVVVARRE